MADFVCCSPCLHGNGNREKISRKRCRIQFLGMMKVAKENPFTRPSATSLFISARERLNKYFNSVALIAK